MATDWVSYVIVGRSRGSFFCGQDRHRGNEFAGVHRFGEAELESGAQYFRAILGSCETRNQRGWCRGPRVPVGGLEPAGSS